MIRTLFTLGYEKRSLNEFLALLRSAGIDVLVDVRETAWSHKPGFSKSALRDALASIRIDYVHAPYVGNPKFLRATAPTHADCLSMYAWYVDAHAEVIDVFDAMVADLLRSGKRICLTCFERHADDCHRSILADRWQSRGGARRLVKHLAVEGCARIVQA